MTHPRPENYDGDVPLVAVLRMLADDFLSQELGTIARAVSESADIIERLAAENAALAEIRSKASAFVYAGMRSRKDKSEIERARLELAVAVTSLDAREARDAPDGDATRPAPGAKEE